jgi:hypothetical protein
MKKFFIGVIIGVLAAFPLGVNFGKDVPLWSNPFAAKPDFSDRVVERAGKTLEEAKEAVHAATKPLKK